MAEAIAAEDGSANDRSAQGRAVQDGDDQATGRGESLVRAADLVAKAGLLLLLAAAFRESDLGNMRDKAAGLRAVAYPLLSFTLPILWLCVWRQRSTPFPWLADLFISVTCFTDILGNRMDLYDTIWWFDDWMHFANLVLLSAAVIMLTLPRTATFAAILERALAFGGVATIGWEVGEYFAFINGSSERAFAYADTLSDLTLGMIGAVVAAIAMRLVWRSGGLPNLVPVTSWAQDHAPRAVGSGSSV